MCQGQFVQLQRIKRQHFAETMRPHYAHNLTSVNSLAQKKKCLVWKLLRDGSVPWLMSSEGKYNIRVVFKAELLMTIIIIMTKLTALTVCDVRGVDERRESLTDLCVFQLFVLILGSALFLFWFTLAALSVTSSGRKALKKRQTETDWLAGEHSEAFSS